jgi:hypothetical protein
MQVIPATQEVEIRKFMFQGQPRQVALETLSQKYLTQKGSSRVAQVVESLPRKYKALASNPIPLKKKKKK